MEWLFHLVFEKLQSLLKPIFLSYFILYLKDYGRHIWVQISHEMDVQTNSAGQCSKAFKVVSNTARHRGEQGFKFLLQIFSKVILHPVSQSSNQPELIRLCWQSWKTLDWTTVILSRRSGSPWLVSLTGSS